MNKYINQSTYLQMQVELVRAFIAKGHPIDQALLMAKDMADKILESNDTKIRKSIRCKIKEQKETTWKPSKKKKIQH